MLGGQCRGHDEGRWQRALFTVEEGAMKQNMSYGSGAEARL